MSTELLSTRAVAKLLSMSESTVRRWCGEGKLAFTRTAGGHRKIELAAVMNLMRESGHAPDESTLIGDYAVKSNRPLHETAKHLADSLCEGHEQSCVGTITAAWSQGYSIATIGDQLLGPAMTGVGQRWATGEINVTAERRACHLAMQSLFEIERTLPKVQDSSPLAVGGTPGEDHSQIGTKLVELMLRSIGWRSRQLGAGIPMADMAETCQSATPDLIWLSVVHLENPTSFVQDYRVHFEPLLQQMNRITIGGRAVDLDIRRQIRFSFYGESLSALQTYAEGLSGTAASVPVSRPMSLDSGFSFASTPLADA